MTSCHAYIDTVEARARAETIYIDRASTTDPNNFFQNVERKIFGKKTIKKEFEYWGDDAVEERRRECLERCINNSHIVTNSVEPLVYALLMAPNDPETQFVTIEFTESNEKSIDVAYLRESVERQQWCGRLFQGPDPQFHNLMTFITLLLIGSSSGIPLYASRNWNIVSQIWRDMVKDSDDPEKWLTRFDESRKRIDICERRFLELIIRLIATTHVSEEEPAKFKPGAMAYVRYVEKFYDRMMKNEQLGFVKTKPWVLNLEEASPKQQMFGQRMRLQTELSYPEDMDDIREAVRVRLSHWIDIEPQNIIFV